MTSHSVTTPYSSNMGLSIIISRFGQYITWGHSELDFERMWVGERSEGGKEWGKSSVMDQEFESRFGDLEYDLWNFPKVVVGDHSAVRQVTEE